MTEPAGREGDVRHRRGATELLCVASQALAWQYAEVVARKTLNIGGIRSGDAEAPGGQDHQREQGIQEAHPRTAHRSAVALASSLFVEGRRISSARLVRARSVVHAITVWGWARYLAEVSQSAPDM